MHESLFTLSKEQNKETAFAFFPHKDQDYDAPFRYLANMAQKEQWNLPSMPYKGDFPILKNYLDHTFRRLKELELVKISPDEQMACFNTGLQTEKEQDIYAVFRMNDKLNSEDWIFYRFCDSYSDLLDSFRPLPEIAHYITNLASLIYDSELRVEISHEHIYEDNKDRLPDTIRENQFVSIALMNSAIQKAQKMVKRNYKIAIPIWYRGKIDLLLPGYLLNGEKPDIAFVTDRVGDIYKVRTIFTMEMAYNNARLIAKPDRDWLNP
ncbi:DUF3825 domain-containing protein [Deinococcus detaillensis]|uniref:DUF3825 domain-containing protein n=1 Tax=Deinococcus detaillensis TaxID=2592048 RepID=A0A553UU21_9DEIO|nr:DUF3825 domain-containing protein [Deinococcus detaillensis]TSA83708.1 DUF3825 domain-containing protein [Deinococcus detaillensis]